MYASRPQLNTREERRAITPKRLHVMNMKRRMEVFSAHSDSDSDDDGAFNCNSNSSFIMMATSELFASSPSSPSLSSYSSDKSSSRRDVLFCITAQLAFVCTFMCAFEGVFRPMALHALVVNETTGVLQRAVRSLPVFIGLLYLLDKSKSSFLWAMQLLVAAKIHMSALGLQNEKEPDRSRAIANVLLALMLLAYPLHRFFRHSLVSKAWLAPLAAVSIAESAVLASIDGKFMSNPHTLLLNCAFFACSTLTMALLSCECMRSLAPFSSAKAGVLAYGVVAIAAMSFRTSVQLSPNVFTISLVTQLALALLISRELAASSLDIVSVEPMASVEVEDEEDEEVQTEVEKPYMSATEFLLIKLFVAVATTAVALLALGLSCVRYLFG